MHNGIALYEWLEPWSVDVYEVFPEATWKLAEQAGLDLQTNLPLTWVCRVAKRSRLDVIDAVGAALTVREVHEGRGALVGGGDGLGAIALPRPLPQALPELMSWPEQAVETSPRGPSRTRPWVHARGTSRPGRIV
jgi:predicted nuclease with RNAse H fold